MIFDSNTAIGHWPFRKIPHQTAAGLRTHLESKGIAGAAAANTHALFYKNAQDANLELAEALAGHRDFFIGVATLNPRYPAWEKDLRFCAERLGLKALRLAPQYHNYSLQEPQAKAIVGLATELNLPVLIPHRLVDIRQRHWMDTERTIGIHEAGQLSLAMPQARIILTESTPWPEELLNSDKTPKYPGLYFEISRSRSAFGQTVAGLLKAVGADRLLFGSGAPFKEVTPALLKLKAVDCSEPERRQIAWDNARSLFRLPDSQAKRQ